MEKLEGNRKPLASGKKSRNVVRRSRVENDVLMLDTILDVDNEGNDIEEELQEARGNEQTTDTEHDCEMLLDWQRLRTKMHHICLKHCLREGITGDVLEMISIAARDRTSLMLENVKAAADIRCGIVSAKNGWSPGFRQNETDKQEHGTETRKEMDDGFMAETRPQQKQYLTVRDCIFVAEDDKNMRRGALLYKWYSRL